MYSHITKCIPIKMYSIYSYFILRYYDLQQMLFNCIESSKLFALSIVSKINYQLSHIFLINFVAIRIVFW